MAKYAHYHGWIGGVNAIGLFYLRNTFLVPRRSNNSNCGRAERREDRLFNFQRSFKEVSKKFLRTKENSLVLVYEYFSQFSTNFSTFSLFSINKHEPNPLLTINIKHHLLLLVVHADDVH